MGSILKAAIRNGYTEVVLVILANSQFIAEDEKVRGCLMLALAKGQIDIAIKIIEHPAFDITHPWVEIFLNYNQEFLLESERRQEALEIIDAIKEKQAENKR